MESSTIYSWLLPNEYPEEEKEWHEPNSRGQMQRITLAGVDIIKQVFSWEGVGKTREILNSNGWIFFDEGGSIAFEKKGVISGLYTGSYNANPLDIEDYFDVVQMTALNTRGINSGSG